MDKKIYVGVPDNDERKLLIQFYAKEMNKELSEDQIIYLVANSESFSRGEVSKLFHEVSKFEKQGLDTWNAFLSVCNEYSL